MSVAEAYAEVERITRREAKNFAYGIMLLPRAKRRAIAAIYAFARRVDDVADGDLQPDVKRARAAWYAISACQPEVQRPAAMSPSDTPNEARSSCGM